MDGKRSSMWLVYDPCVTDNSDTNSKVPLFVQGSSIKHNLNYSFQQVVRKGYTCCTCLFKRISGDQRSLLIVPQIQMSRLQSWKQWNGVLLTSSESIKHCGSKVIKPFVCTSCRDAPPHPCWHWHKCNLAYTHHTTLKAPLFHHLSILQTSKTPVHYRSLFCCLPISRSPRSNMFGDWILVVTSQTIGAWLPPALSDQHWLPSTRHHLSPLTTFNRAPCYSPNEALARPLHNEAVKKRGAD